MALTKNFPLTTLWMGQTLASVATGGSAYIRAPFRGKILEAATVIGTATTTADATVTVSIGATAVTGASFVITQSGSAAGDIDYASTADSGANSVITGASGSNIFNQGDLIKFALTGSGTGGGNVYCSVVAQKLA